MNQSQENRKGMFSVTTEFYNLNSVAMNAVPLILTKMTLFSGKNIAIQALLDEQNQPTTGATTDKKLSKRALARTTSNTLGPARTFARSIGDNNLLAKFDYSMSQIEDLPDQDVQATINTIVAALNANIDDMGPVGLTAAHITAITTLLTTYLSLKDKPRTIIADRSVATEMLEPALDEGTALLIDVDDLMLQFRDTNPTLYNGWKAARVIVDN